MFNESSMDDMPPSYDEDRFFPMGKPEVSMETVKCIDTEVGDDLLRVSNNWQFLVCSIAVLVDYLDLRISWKDTSINSGLGNYSESLLRVPRKYSETWLSQKSLKRGRTLGFIDVPKIRLMLPVRSQRMKFSSTDVGKFTDYGNTVAWTPKESPYYCTTVLGSLIQDALLGAQGKRQCLYLPTEFGGSGKPFPFLNTGNFIRYLDSWKTGRYKAVITTVIKQANRFLMSASTMGGRPVVPKLLEYFTKYEPVFTDWVKDDNIITAHRAPIPDELCAHQAGTLKYGDQMYWVLPRLITEGKVVTETKLQIAIQHNHLSHALVSMETYPEFKARLEDAHKDWRANQLLQGEIVDNDEFKREIALYTGTGAIRAQEIERFITSTTNVRGFRRLIQSERVYWPSALDGIYRDGPMSLKGMFANPNLSGGRHKYVESWDFSPDIQMTSEEIEGSMELEKWVHNPVGEPPRTAIEDDDIIVREINSMELEKNIMLVTDDIRLCQRIGILGRIVLRIPVEWYYRVTYFGDGFSEEKCKELQLAARLTGPWAWVEDSGSIQSGEEKYFRDGMMYPSGLPQETLDHAMAWNSKPIGKGTPEEIDWGEIETPPWGFPQRFLFGRGQRIRKRTNITHG